MLPPKNTQDKSLLSKWKCSFYPHFPPHTAGESEAPSTRICAAKFAYLRRFIFVYAEIFFRIYRNIFVHIRKFRPAYTLGDMRLSKRSPIPLYDFALALREHGGEATIGRKYDYLSFLGTSRCLASSLLATWS